MSGVQEIIDSFNSVRLKDMDKIALMTRKDSKFLMPKSKLPVILEKLKEFYNILEIDGHRLMHYENYYYDTDQFDFYLNHHNGHLNRYKIRKRKYTVSDISFLEIKFKSNKKQTSKNRIKKKDFVPGFTEEDIEFIKNKSPFDPNNLSLKLLVDFSRITLAHKNNEDRATLDLNLTYRFGDFQYSYSNICIGELKQDKSAIKSDFINVLNDEKIKKGGFSKFCFGMLNAYPHLKKNLFKKKLRGINKLQHEYSTT